MPVESRFAISMAAASRSMSQRRALRRCWAHATSAADAALGPPLPSEPEGMAAVPGSSETWHTCKKKNAPAAAAVAASAGATGCWYPENKGRAGGDKGVASSQVCDEAVPEHHLGFFRAPWESCLPLC